eukprot:UN19548
MQINSLTLRLIEGGFLNTCPRYMSYVSTKSRFLNRNLIPDLFIAHLENTFSRNFCPFEI